MTELVPESSTNDSRASKSIKIHIETSRCKGCSFCTEFCPREVLAMSQQINPKGYTFIEVRGEKKCSGCALCEIMCPEFAIKVVRQ